MYCMYHSDCIEVIPCKSDDDCGFQMVCKSEICTAFGECLSNSDCVLVFLILLNTTFTNHLLLILIFDFPNAASVHCNVEKQEIHTLENHFVKTTFNFCTI